MDRCILTGVKNKGYVGTQEFDLVEFLSVLFFSRRVVEGQSLFMYAIELQSLNFSFRLMDITRFDFHRIPTQYPVIFSVCGSFIQSKTWVRFESKNLGHSPPAFSITNLSRLIIDEEDEDARVVASSYHLHYNAVCHLVEPDEQDVVQRSETESKHLIDLF